VKGVTCGTLMGAGDVIAQLIEARGDLPGGRKVNWVRVGRMTAIGCAIGPVLHHWYLFLERSVTGVGTVAALKKLALDQTLFAPVLLATITTLIGASEGKNLEQLKTGLKNNYVEALKLNYCVWPFANFVTFKYIPERQRVLFVSLVSLGWNTLLSNIAHKSHDEHQLPDEENTSLPSK
jgi:protein Mpv17